MTEEQVLIKNVGKQDPKRHMGETVDRMLASNVAGSIINMADVLAISEQ